MHDFRCFKQGWSLTHPNCSAMTLNATNHLSPSITRGVFPTQRQGLDSRFCKSLSLAHLQGVVLPTWSQVDDSKSYKLFFSCPSARGESYPPKLKCITTDVSNNFYPSPLARERDLPTQTLFHDYRCCKLTLSPTHQQGGSLTQPNLSA